MRLTRLVLQLALLALSEAVRCRRRAGGQTRERRSCGGRDCTDEELYLVRRSRHIFQELIAVGDLAEMRDAPQLERVLQYMENALEIVSAEAKLHAEPIRVALADAITEYMHGFVLPIAKYLYYAGALQYADIRKANNFYGFAVNMSSMNESVIGATIPFSNFSQLNLNITPISQPKTNPDENNCNELYTTLTADGETVIALPYFDAHSVALPLKEKPIRDLRSQYSDNILVKFYVYSIDCFSERNSNYSYVRNFRRGLLDLINTNVVPRLLDPELYPAFAGSIKLIHTLNYYQENESDAYMFLTTRSLFNTNESNYSTDIAENSTILIRPTSPTAALLRIVFISGGLIGIIFALLFLSCKLCIEKIIKTKRGRYCGDLSMYKVVPGLFDSLESIDKFELPIAKHSTDSPREDGTVLIVEPNHDVKTIEATTQTKPKKRFKCRTAELQAYSDELHLENVGNNRCPVHGTSETILPILETDPNATVDWSNPLTVTSKSNNYFESVLFPAQATRAQENKGSSTSSGGSFDLFSSKFHALFKRARGVKIPEEDSVEFGWTAHKKRSFLKNAVNYLKFGRFGYSCSDIAENKPCDI